MHHFKYKINSFHLFSGSCLHVHNKLRALHKDTPNLQWDSTLASEAQNWANYLLSIKSIVHSTSEHGENLAYGAVTASSSITEARTCDDAIVSW